MQNNVDLPIVATASARQDAAPAPERQPYVTPELREEGAVEQLTGGVLAGSGRRA